MEHTSLPWRVQNNGEGDIFIYSEVDDSPVIEDFAKVEDAELVCRAVNSHYELLEACKELVAELDNRPLKRSEYGYCDTGGLILARQAIKKAKGGN